ncbi:hypothetical protein EW146_g3877 [Bondarzewia mesenterica]|uniref:rRNA biogenesis protein RRP36 n=1 Tax=Bondarzewia mesenterica TaxID=1095465 RepID=A0A4S4LW77_9AGAM|nr:hypothetical protein EW146_g3877 [Bondarzewia mesenterica]
MPKHARRFQQDSGDVSDEVDYERDEIDAPRVVQWIGEEELQQEESDVTSEEDEQEDGFGESSSSDNNDQTNMNSLRNNLSSLPFGALQRAQRVLSQARAESDSEADEDAEASSSEAEEEPSRWGREEKGKAREEPKKTKKDIPKRKDKHAPTEITSKRPVPRRRTVVEVPKVEARDPRFLPLAGEFDSTKFRSQYGFIADMHQNELKTLRDSLKRARKLLASYLAIFAKSGSARDKRERVEQEALSNATKEEHEKRRQGKGKFWLKQSAKKDLLLKARYDAVAAEGGRGAVRKAIEKKQKKISQKETKSRPFARSEAFSGRGDGERSREMGKRHHGRSDDTRGGKRRKIG